MLVPNIAPPKFEVPVELSKLPVLKIQNEIDLTQDFILTAQTGTGKTMLIPPFISHEHHRIVILRQPTRKMAKKTKLDLEQFWGKQLLIGVITSEDKEIQSNQINSYDIIVVTDGILSFILKQLDLSRTTVIFDEAHWMMSQTEVEMVLCNQYKQTNPQLQIVYLSATIDPEPFLMLHEGVSDPTPSLKETLAHKNTPQINSLPQNHKMKVYYAEGTTFDMTKEVIKVESDLEASSAIAKLCIEAKNESQQILIFLSTRAQIQEHQLKFQRLLPTFYNHADTPIEDLISFINTNTPCVVFATISMSTSMNFPFHKSIILDKTNDSTYSPLLQQTIQFHGVSCGNNEILQKAGRTARFFPGTAILITERDINFSDITPSKVIPPLEKVLPISAVLTGLSHNIDISKSQLLSKLDTTQTINSIKRLQQMKFIDSSNKITKTGKRAVSLPLEPEEANIALKIPDKFLPLICAHLSFPNGLFYIFTNSQKITDAQKKKYTFNSIPITKAKVLQDCLLANDLSTFCKKNHINKTKVHQAIFRYKNLSTYFNRTPDDFVSELTKFNFSNDALLKAFKLSLTSLQLKFPINFKKSGYNIKRNGETFYSFLSDREFFNPSDDEFNIGSNFSLFKTQKSNNIFGRLEDATIIPEPKKMEMNLND